MDAVLIVPNMNPYRAQLLLQIADMERALVGDPTSPYFKGRLEAFRLSLQLLDLFSEEMSE